MNMSESGQMKVNHNASHDRKMITGLGPEKAECGKRICMSQFKVVGWDFLELRKGKDKSSSTKTISGTSYGNFYYDSNKWHTQYWMSKSKSILTVSVYREHIM